MFRNNNEDNQQYFNEIAIKYTQATALAFSIRMLAPVYAESFVNTLIFLLADDDVKKDKRLYDSIIRQNIDIRVKQLHRNCNGFVLLTTIMPKYVRNCIRYLIIVMICYMET